ncbi:hypothetical protein IWQ62_002854 [Dispira parvispora]|uniref:Uncharacterized protein n=1 Tax=Dispira parvispora TaxID=1520584 RepID=A0A9W8E292_9FUNG|nr:hypothetical protein IWQ62_002854 [Dispira parvispora]
MVTTAVYIADVVQYDISLFQKWAQGITNTALAELVHTDYEWPKHLAAEYVQGQLYSYEYLETFLESPSEFVAQSCLFPLDTTQKQDLIEIYYSFDSRLMRELLGKKPTSHSRKDIESLALRLKIPLASCRRQVENLKRITKRVEDVEGVTLVEEIQQKFVLPLPVASQYAHTIFINSNRLDTTKRKLAPYKFDDFDACAHVFIDFWTSSTSTLTLDDIDELMVQAVRSFKNQVVDNRVRLEELRVQLMNHLTTMANTVPGNPAALPDNPGPCSVSATPVSPGANKTSTSLPPGQSSSAKSSAVKPSLAVSSVFGSFARPASRNPDTVHRLPSQMNFFGVYNAIPPSTNPYKNLTHALEYNPAFFKQYIRTLLRIGTLLTNSTEFRSIFSVLVEKVLEPCVQLHLSQLDIECLFDTIVAVVEAYVIVPGDSTSFIEGWTRQQRLVGKFLQGVKLAALHLLQNYSRNTMFNLSLARSKNE